MRVFLGFVLVLLLVGWKVVAQGVEVGDKAPGFSMPGSDGEEYSLDQFAGEKAVVIAWFPKAFTGG